MEVTASRASTVDAAIRVDPRPFRRGRDGAIAAVLLVVAGGCVVGAAVRGHAAFVLGAVYASMAGLVWLEAFRSSWAIGPDEVAARRFTRWRRIRAADVAVVAIEPGEPGVDLAIDAARGGRVVLPLDDWRHDAGALDRLRTFLARAEHSGARVDAAVWRALDRR